MVQQVTEILDECLGHEATVVSASTGFLYKVPELLTDRHTSETVQFSMRVVHS